MTACPPITTWAAPAAYTHWVERLVARCKRATGYVDLIEWSGCGDGSETRDCSSIGADFGGDFHVQVSGCAPQAVLDTRARSRRLVLA